MAAKAKIAANEAAQAFEEARKEAVACTATLDEVCAAQLKASEDNDSIGVETSVELAVRAQMVASAAVSAAAGKAKARRNMEDANADLARAEAFAQAKRDAAEASMDAAKAAADVALASADAIAEARKVADAEEEELRKENAMHTTVYITMKLAGTMRTVGAEETAARALFEMNFKCDLVVLLDLGSDGFDRVRVVSVVSGGSLGEKCNNHVRTLAAVGGANSSCCSRERGETR